MSLEIGNIMEGKVSGITKFGAFVDFPGGSRGLVHISEVSNEYVKDIAEYLKEGQLVKVKVLSVDDKGRVSLSIKKAMESEKKHIEKPRDTGWKSAAPASPLSFEDKLLKFMKDSDERLLDIKRNSEAKRGGSNGR